jgi:outer membrane receptor protein involved in Fe transport
MKRSTISVLTLSMAALSHSAGSLAQEGTLEEIIVTAQKREQRLIEVPVSITALSGQELEQRGLSSIQDISFAVPGMAMREDGPGSYTIFMRGLSNQYGSDALVGVYLDEAPLSLTGFDQLDSRVMDLERVEVLKGPQGTLYGQGSVAGAVRYITKDPVLESFEGKVEASQAYIEDGDTKETLTGIVNVPLGESLAVRLAGTIERGGGWQDQPQAGIEDGNNQDLENFRAKVLWRITDAFDAQLMVVLHRNESQLGLGYENPDRTITVGVDRARVLVPKEFEYDLYNLDLTYDFGGVQLLSSTTYIDHRHQYPFSYIGGPETFYVGELEGTDERHTRAHQFTQEVRLGSTGEGPLNWTAGAFYRSLGHQLTAVYDTLFGGVVFPDAFYLDANEYESYAIFADASYDVTEKLEIGVGVRYFEDDQTTFDGTLTEADSFDSTDPRVYMSYKFTPDLNVYASAAKGFRSGGFNRGELPNYEPESLWSYELGVKGQTEGGVLGFEAAVYYSDYSDMLRRGLVFVEETTTFESLTTNIGKVEVKGVEAGLTWRPTQALALNATASYIDSEITEVNATDATSLPGDPVDYVPEFSYTASAHYSFDWSAMLPGYARVDYSYRDAVSYVDRTSFPAENLPQFADEIGLVDARLGLTWGKASFELYGTNLTNENNWIDPYHQWTNANRTRPRAVGLKAAYSFK